MMVLCSKQKEVIACLLVLLRAKHLTCSTDFKVIIALIKRLVPVWDMPLLVGDTGVGEVKYKHNE